MSDADRDAILGRTLREFKTAREDLAALHAEAERIGNYLTEIGHELRTNHSAAIDAEKWPIGDSLKKLTGDIRVAREEKQRLEKLLSEAGHPQDKK